MSQISYKYFIILVLVSLASLVHSIWLKPTRKPTGCGDHQNHGPFRIKNRAFFGEFPFEAQITVVDFGNKNEQISCSGAILAPNKVLTSIKCVTRNVTAIEAAVNLNLSVTIKAGFVGRGQGKEVPILVTHLDARGYDNVTCGQGIFAHGLALLTLEKDLDFSIAPYGGKNHNINSVCESTVKPKLGDRLHLVSFFDQDVDDKCQQVVDVLVVKCPHDTSERIFCIDSLNGLEFYNYLEGAPIVRRNGMKRWELVGIHSREYDPWNRVSDDNEKTSLAVFADFRQP